MYPTLIEINGFQITTYGFLIACAFATLWLLSMRRGVKLGYREEFIQNILMITVICAFLFARLLHIIVDWEFYLKYPWKILFSREGFIFLGGFVGAVICISIYTKKQGYSINGVSDLFAPYLALAQGIGRIGCTLFGCCYGKVCGPEYGVQFPHGSPAFYEHLYHGLISQSAKASLPVYPTQIYHSLFNFAHFGILLWIRSKQTFRGQLAMCYLMIYGVGRFVIEFYRGDPRGEYGPFSTSQVISFTMFLCGSIGYWILKRKQFPPETIQPTLPEASNPQEIKQ